MVIAILGGGLAGLAAARELSCLDPELEILLIEKEKELGGLLKTDQARGFCFDYGPHVFFHQDQLFLKVFEESLGDIPTLKKLSRAGQWSYRKLIEYPYALHLYGLPENIVSRCVGDFIIRQLELKEGQAPKPQNYEEYCRQYFGDGFTDCFMTNYAKKIWTVEPQDLDVDWVGPRIVLPDVREVINGALAPRTISGNYIKEFRYPGKGGTQSLVKGFVDRTPSKQIKYVTGSEVVAVDLKKKKITDKNGKIYAYDQIISTIPLPELQLIILDLPDSIEQDLQGLKWFGVILLNYSSSNIVGNPYHWIYFDQKDTLFHRIHYPAKIADQMAPDGGGSLQAEISFSRYRQLPADSDSLLERSWKDLKALGFVTGNDPDLSFTRSLDYAYVIMDHERARRVSNIKQFLAGNSMVVCGRFGEWDYLWTDKVLHSGIRAAQQVIGQPLKACA